MNQVKLLRELTFRERTMKDFEELRKLCCADNPGAFEVSATSNGFEKNTKRGLSFVAPGAKDSITKLKKRKEVLCENSSAGSEGQNGDSTERTYPEIEKKGQKSFTLKKKKAVLEKRQAKANVEEGCITKPENVSNEDKAKRKPKCVGGTTKTNKAISTLSDMQYEKIFQSVIDKSLEECIESSKKLIHKVKSLQENSELLLVSENVVPSEPSANKSSEESEAQGVRKTKAKSKDNKANKLSRKNKILTDANEINEVSTVGRRHKRKGQPKKIVQDYTKFIDDDEESALEFSNRPSPPFIATSRSDTTRGSGSMEPSRGDSSHDVTAGNSDPWATPAALRDYLPKEEEESFQDSPAQRFSKSLSRGTREVGQYRNVVFGCQQPEGEVGEVLASRFLELQQEGFHVLHRDLMQLQEIMGEGISSFSRKLGKRLVRLSSQMSVLVELLRDVSAVLVPGPSEQISVACQTDKNEVYGPSRAVPNLISSPPLAGPEATNSRVQTTPLLSATLRKRRSSVTTRSIETPSKVDRAGI
ncbi:uncharacterized protein LOC125448808 [Stegostoma tigrinum]|uniref:uncharacterized protein LOC125448808 n=1 Tax=Stegostoma tigrinum TaxID=3053191 RepID=UPI00202B343E|nr:uncharacterized protein LOC125448808 [Stegostoma tigrinum]